MQMWLQISRIKAAGKFVWESVKSPQQQNYCTVFTHTHITNLSKNLRKNQETIEKWSSSSAKWLAFGHNKDDAELSANLSHRWRCLTNDLMNTDDDLGNK